MEGWSANRVVNNDRSWFMYQGPLREYPSACTAWDVKCNAWDCWGGAWRHNHSLSTRAPFNMPSSCRNKPIFLKNNKRLRVMMYCPNMNKTDGPGTWWHEWRAPHLNQPWPGDNVQLDPIFDARNYLFNDGHVIFFRR